MFVICFSPPLSSVEHHLVVYLPFIFKIFDEIREFFILTMFVSYGHYIFRLIAIKKNGRIFVFFFNKFYMAFSVTLNSIFCIYNINLMKYGNNRFLKHSLNYISTLKDKEEIRPTTFTTQELYFSNFYFNYLEFAINRCSIFSRIIINRP